MGLNISNYSLFEVAYAALKSVSDPHDKNEVADAIHKVNLPQAVAGPLNFASGRPRAGRRDHPAGGRAVAEGHQVPGGDAGRRQHQQPQAKITADLLPTNQ